MDHPPRVLDGAMGTTLAARLALPPDQRTSSCSLSHPDEVRAVHRAFRSAGADVLCTNTLTSLPEVTEDWRDEIRAGVQLARDAAGGAAVWLSMAVTSHADRVVHLDPAVDGVMVETIVDAQRGAAVARAIRTVWQGPLVLSFVPDRPGALPPPDDLLALVRDLSLTAIGVNCIDTATALQALRTVPPGVPRWVKPSSPSVADLLQLTRHADAVGGCCGTTPARLAAFTAATPRWTRRSD